MIQKGIRGAISVEENTVESISENTRMLLERLFAENKLENNEIVSVIFTATKDLTKIYPAKIAREMGFTDIPLMCLQEMFVEYSLEKCLRILVTINCDQERQIRHVYLKKATKLRPDIA